MKVLHLLAQRPGHTGSGIYFLNLIDQLKDFGFTQAALYASSPDQNHREQPGVIKYPVFFQTEALPYPVVGMSDDMPYLSTTYSYLEAHLDLCDQWNKEMERAMVEAKNDFQPDIILSHHLWMLTAKARSVFKDIPVFGFCHGTDLRQSKRNPGLRENYVVGINQLDHIFSLSPAQSREIETEFSVASSKITILGGGYREDLFYPNHKKSNNRAFRLGYAGKLSREKGIFDLLEAYQRVCRTHPKTELHLAGRASEEIKSRLEQYKQHCRHLQHHAHLSQKDLGDFFRACDLFVFPSYYEGLGLVVIESLACGLPILSASHESLKSLLDPRLEEKGWIRYVELPEMRKIGDPYEHQLTAYQNRWTKAIREAVTKRAGKPIKNKDMDWLQTFLTPYSWKGIAKRVAERMLEYQR